MFENIINFLYYNLLQKLFTSGKFVANEVNEKIFEELNKNKLFFNFYIQEMVSEYNMV